MNNWVKFIVLITTLLVVSCNSSVHNESVQEIIVAFGLPNDLMDKSELLIEGNGVKVNLPDNYFYEIKISHGEFSEWYPLKIGSSIHSNNFVIQGTVDENVIYSVGEIINGNKRVLVYYKKENTMYALFVDGLM